MAGVLWLFRKKIAKKILIAFQAHNPNNIKPNFKRINMEVDIVFYD